MKNIVKSFYNYMLTFWYQFLAFVLFVIIACALTVGFTSNSLQIIAITSQINTTEKSWDYDVATSFFEFNNDFIYKYFETNDSGFRKDLPTLLNWEYQVDNQSLEEYLREAYQSNNPTSLSWEKYVGQFIRRNVFSTSFLTQHQVLLPRKTTNAPNKFGDFFGMVKPEWQKLTAKSYGEVYNLMNQDLMNTYNQKYPNDYLELSVNKMFRFHPNESANETNETYSLEPINLGLINNVVSNLSQSRLYQMQDNEVLINDKFARQKGWKIGDQITLHDFALKDGDGPKYQEIFGIDTPFNKQYKIIGWGSKIQNLFASYDFLNPTQNNDSINSGFFYLTNNEFDRYWSYLWFYNNVLYHDSINNEDNQQTRTRVSPQSNYFERLKVQNTRTLTNFNREMSTYRTAIKVIFGYNSLYFVQAFQIYLIEGIVFTLVGFISLVFAVLFVNYSIKKQLRQMRRQLGLFKALGYGSSELSTVLWSRTYVLLIVGVIVGYIVSIPIQLYVNRLMVPNFYVIVEPIWTNPIYLFAIFGILPLLLSLFNFAAIIRYLRKNALSMIYMDKDFSLATSYGRTVNWLIKSRYINLGKVHINFSWKQFFMALFIPLFFMFGSLLLMIQFNINTLMTTTVDINSHIYEKGINYSITLDQNLNWEESSKTQAEEKYMIKDKNFLNFHYENYQNFSDLEKYHNLELDRAITNYLAATNIAQKAAPLLAINQANVNHQAINLKQFIRFGQQLIKDYDQYRGQLPALEAFAETVENLKNILNLTNQYQSLLDNDRLLLTINNAFIKNGIDFPMLKLDLYDFFRSMTTGTWSLFLVNDQNHEVFSSLNYETLKKATDQVSGADFIPVIISEQYSVKNKIYLHDEITNRIYLNFSGSPVKLNFKVVGINNDKVSSNFYALESYFLEHYVDTTLLQNSETKHLYNSIYSKGELFDLSQQNWQSAPLKNDYFNFYYSTPNETVTLSELFNNSQNLFNYFNWENLASSNFRNFALEQKLAYQTINGVVQLVYILLGLTLLLLLTLFGVFFILGTVDNQLQIKLFKAFGYSESYISLHLLRRHIISITIGVLLAILVNYFIWYFLMRWLFAEFGLLLYNPFTITWTIVSCLIIVGLFVMGSMIAFQIIRRTSPVIKAL